MRQPGMWPMAGPLTLLTPKINPGPSGFHGNDGNACTENEDRALVHAPCRRAGCFHTWDLGGRCRAGDNTRRSHTADGTRWPPDARRCAWTYARCWAGRRPSPPPLWCTHERSSRSTVSLWNKENEKALRETLTLRAGYSKAEHSVRLWGTAAERKISLRRSPP